MKNRLFSKYILLLTSLIIFASAFSCSQTALPPGHYSRSIAQNEISSYELNDLIEKSLEINKTSKVSQKNLIPEFSSNNFNLKLSKVEFVENKDLSSSLAYKIIPYLLENEYHIQVQYSSLAKMDQGAFLELKSFFAIFSEKKNSAKTTDKIISALMGKETYKETAFFELLYNAKKGNLNAITDLLSIRINANATDASFFREKIKSLDVKKYNEKTFYSRIHELKNNSEFLDKINKNDRIGVAQLIEKQIHWESLTPFEKDFWEKQLMIIKHPLPLQERIIVYRGVKMADILNQHQDSISKISQKQSFYQLPHFFNSDGNIANAYLDTKMHSSNIANRLKVHSTQSSKSLFISVSPQINVAKGFSLDAVSIFVIDPRALIFNEASAFIDESEYLLSFITFPEDVLGIVEISKQEKGINPVEAFKFENKIAGRIVENLKNKKLNSDLIYAQLKKNTSEYFGFLHKDAKVNKNVIRNILGQSLGKNSEVIVVKRPSSLLNNCFKLMQLFF